MGTISNKSDSFSLLMMGYMDARWHGNVELLCGVYKNYFHAEKNRLATHHLLNNTLESIGIDFSRKPRVSSDVIREIDSLYQIRSAIKEMNRRLSLIVGQYHMISISRSLCMDIEGWVMNVKIDEFPEYDRQYLIQKVDDKYQIKLFSHPSGRKSGFRKLRDAMDFFYNEQLSLVKCLYNKEKYELP